MRSRTLYSIVPPASWLRSVHWQTIEQLPPQNEIRRENLQQLVVVTGRLEGSDLGTAIGKVQQMVGQMHLPPTVRVEYGGTYQEQQQSFHELLRVLLLALALVFGVLLAEFRNFAAPFAILTSSVLSISGVVFALLITGTDFNVASFMGLIMIIGIVAKNGILLLDADEKYRAEGAAPREAMLHAAQRRLRPIVMTAMAAMCGMLPLGFRAGFRIADAATPGNRSDRWSAGIDRPEPGCDACNLLPDDTRSTRRDIKTASKNDVSLAFGCWVVLRPFAIRCELVNDAQRPTTRTLKLPGAIEGRGCGVSAVGAGRGPNSAVVR